MKPLLFASAAALLAVAAPSAEAADAICYNCPPEWADWASVLEAINEDLGLEVPHDNKNSGQSLAQLIAERENPVADVVYMGVTFGGKAKNEGVTQSYAPALLDEVPDGLKDPEDHWFAIHSGTLGFFVNVDALGGAEVPQCWNDLRDSAYEGLVGYLDPSSAFVGYVGAVAVNRALGGSLDNFDPAIDYFQALAENDALVPQQTSYARVVSGEIPILFDYDFNAYRAKYDESGNFEFVIPCEGSIVVPYVMSLVADAPNADNGRQVLDYVLSDAGQALWANAYLRPVRDIQLPEEVAARFLPDSEYERASPIDYTAMEAAQSGFADRYRAEVR